MAMNTATFRDVVSPFLNTVFDGQYNAHPAEWSRFFKVEEALDRSYEEEVVLYNFGYAPVKGQGAPITYDQGGEHYKTPFQYVVYALAFALTEELMEDGEHIKIGSKYSAALANSMRVTKEQFHANVLNNATSGSYLGGDGVSLLSTSHPYALGGTFSNTLATQADISEASLEQLLIQMNTARDGRTLAVSIKPKMIIISPQIQYEAERILRSVLRVATGNNDINAMKSMGQLQGDDSILVNHYLTGTTFYGIVSDAEQGFIHKRRRALRKKMEGDFETGNMRYKADERYYATWVDPRCMYGSPGLA